MLRLFTRHGNGLVAMALLSVLAAIPVRAKDRVAPSSSVDVAKLLLPPVSVSNMIVDGRTYTIFVVRPPKPPPPGGFPALVVLDANTNFATAANSAWSRSAYADIAPVVVVGIGYPSGDAQQFNARRSFDFTSAAASKSGSPYLAGQATGGAEAFRENVVAAVLKTVERDEHVNARCSVLFGHSLAGLFVVDTLMQRPDMFEGYFAVSPSLYVNGPEVFDKERWIRSLAQLSHPVRVRLEVGEREAKISERQLEAFPEYRTAPDARMVSNLVRLGDLLAGVSSPKIQVSSAVLAGESHLSEVPRVLSEAITFASECPTDSEAH